MTHTNVRPDEFTLSTAQYVLHCRDAHDPDKVRRAALWILGSLMAPPDDVRLATGLLATTAFV